MYDILIRSNPELAALLKETEEVCSYLWYKGWAERNAGNISVRLDTLRIPENDPAIPCFSLPVSFPSLAGQCFFITGTGRRMRDIQKGIQSNTLIIRIHESGQSWCALSHSAGSLGALRPSSELISHLMIHRHLITNRSGLKAVVHTHPNAIIALSHMPLFRDPELFRRVIWSMQPEAVVFLPEGAGLVPYEQTGGEALGGATLKALESHRVVVWEKHGCLAVAEDPGAAFDLIDLVDKSADIYLRCRSAGIEPAGLSDQQMKSLRESFHKNTSL
ncbi:MAG TPA: rhamnulose-1-phosphate aldolase [Bacteroidales bacterium]|nr:rhamnulose-1-phosphate aldolase [Bacteroidales bacterium]HSA42181.1 rhamnulose-1-phosphate aldolase [Bacteroidales bacterium]